MAERIARGIVPKWTNVSAANTMEYENALNAAMLEGHGSVVGLLHAVYTGDVDESQEGYLKYQLLKLEQSSDGEGANAEGEELDWGADPMALLQQAAPSESSSFHREKSSQPNLRVKGEPRPQPSAPAAQQSRATATRVRAVEQKEIG